MQQLIWVGISPPTEANLTSSEVLVLPNPTSGVFALEIPSSISIQKVILNNGSGNKIWETAPGPDNVIHIDISGFPAGLYSVSVITSNGKIIVKKIMKN